MFLPPSGSAMLMDDLVSRATWKPAPVNFSSTSARLRTSPWTARASSPSVICCATC